MPDVTTDHGAVLDVHHSHFGGQYVATCKRCGITEALWEDEAELKTHVCEVRITASQLGGFVAGTYGYRFDTAVPEGTHGIDHGEWPEMPTESAEYPWHRIRVHLNGHDYDVPAVEGDHFAYIA
jgi:predicted nucleic-acid-binding Zn-ribbon protein